MAKINTNPEEGTLYSKTEDGSWEKIGTAKNPTIGLEPKIHRALRTVCRYHTISYDSYKDVFEDACHHVKNIPQGCSWGECSATICPLANLF